MREAAPRGPLVRLLRRIRVRWRAFRSPEDGRRPEHRPPLLRGVSPDQQKHAIEHACELLGGSAAGEVHCANLQTALGFRLQEPDGTATWIKISRRDDPIREATLPRERNARAFPGVPMPEILREIEWRVDDFDWHAFQFSFAPSPAVSPTPRIGASVSVPDDAWFAHFKDAMDALSALPLSQWLIHPGVIARINAQRYGRKAPYEIDEWRVAHGDLHWSNITAPQLSLLDWERWGAAPRGFDIAMLLTMTIMNPDLYRRIERLFRDDLDTQSGVVARLYAAARRLNRIEAGFRDPREHRPLEAEVRRLLRM